jgi:hypothetical protein
VAKKVRGMYAGPHDLDAFDHDAERVKDLNEHYAREALEQGTKRSRMIASETMGMVRNALDLDYLGKY